MYEVIRQMILCVDPLPLGGMSELSLIIEVDMIDIKSEVEKIISQSNVVFDLESYRKANKLIDILRNQAMKLDQWAAIMAKSCEHVSTRTSVENNYTTTRCNHCGYVISSKPLPGIEWDKD